MKQEDEEGDDDDEEDDEDEEESEEESSDDDTLPRLKPVFVRKKDRITLIAAEKEKQLIEERKKFEEKRLDERKRDSAKVTKCTTLRIIRNDIKSRNSSIDPTVFAKETF